MLLLNVTGETEPRKQHWEFDGALWGACRNSAPTTSIQVWKHLEADLFWGGEFSLLSCTLPVRCQHLLVTESKACRYSIHSPFLSFTKEIPSPCSEWGSAGNKEDSPEGGWGKATYSETPSPTVVDCAPEWHHRNATRVLKSFMEEVATELDLKGHLKFDSVCICCGT